MNEATPTADQAAAELDIMRVAQEADTAPAETTTPPAPAQLEPTDAAASAQTPAETKAPEATAQQKPADQKPADPKPEDKEAGTPYEKSKKDAERRDRSWKALEAEKSEFRAERTRIEAELAALRREIAQAKQQPAKPAAPAQDRHGLSADDYEDLEKRYKDEGRDDLAAVAKDRAQALRAQAQAAPAAPSAPDFTSPDFQREWQAEVQACVQQDPSLNDPSNPITKAANLLVNDANYGKILRSTPKGIRYAVEIAKMMHAAQAATTEKTAHEATKAELAKVQAEVQRLSKLLQPQRSHPTSAAPVAKSPEDLSTDDIRALAAAADRGE